MLALGPCPDNLSPIFNRKLQNRKPENPWITAVPSATTPPWPDIDQALMDGLPLSPLGAQYGLSSSALSRHLKHLRQALAARDHHEHQAHQAALLDELDLLKARLNRLFRKSEDLHSFHISLGCIQESIRLLTLQEKIRHSLTRRPMIPLSRISAAPVRNPADIQRLTPDRPSACLRAPSGTDPHLGPLPPSPNSFSVQNAKGGKRLAFPPNGLTAPKKDPRLAVNPVCRAEHPPYPRITASFSRSRMNFSA